MIQSIVDSGFQCFGIGSTFRNHPFIIEEFDNLDDTVKRKQQMENSTALIPDIEQYESFKPFELDTQKKA